ncbi:MAG: hypothetical protein JXA11_15255, partial [Phycisphaerae bacterium]|nr:hypothetical protein [Phycisphaerae bacterium]
RIPFFQDSYRLEASNIIRNSMYRCYSVYKAMGKDSELLDMSDRSELDMEDRNELDEAVLELLGVKTKAERKAMVEKIHDYLREFFELTRQKEEKAIVNKNKSRKRGTIKPSDIASQLYEHIHETEGHLLRQYNPDFLDMSKPFDTYELPGNGIPQAFSDLYTPHGVQFVQGKGNKVIGNIKTTIKEQDDLIVLLADSGVRGLVRIPREAEECRYRTGQYERFVQERNNRLGELIAERISDPDVQEKVFNILQTMMNSR